MITRPASRTEHIARFILAQIASAVPPSTGNEIVNAIAFDVTTPSPRVLLPIPTGAVFNRAAVIVEVAFDDPTATLQLGTSSDASKFLRVADSSLQTVNCYDSGELFVLASDVLVLTVNAATSTVGEGYVFYRILLS